MRVDIFVNKKVWRAMDEKDLAKYKRKVFRYFRKNGFPHYQTDRAFRDKEFGRLKKCDISLIKQDDVIMQNMLGLSLAWSYFPHSWDVVCNKGKTPIEVFDDDKTLKEVIDKRVKYGDNMSVAMIRKVLKVYCGAQAVSNFRPTAAAAIYDYFNAATVWDMCGGWGGRLLGAIVSESVKKYTATEPSVKTYKGLAQLNRDYGSGQFKILNKCAEDFKPRKETIDLCFTSPPYFDREKYANEKTQSYIKFPTKEEWVEGFLDKMLRNCFHGNRQGGHTAINIANVSGHDWIEEATVDCAERCGFKFKETLKLQLSGGLHKPGDDFKYENIFVFRKPVRRK